MPDITEKLERLFSLLEAGALTREEFDEQKAALLAKSHQGDDGAGTAPRQRVPVSVSTVSAVGLPTVFALLWIVGTVAQSFLAPSGEIKCWGSDPAQPLRRLGLAQGESGEVQAQGTSTPCRRYSARKALASSRAVSSGRSRSASFSV